MNTLLGMGTVFVVLIFISFLIARFKIIPTLFGPKKKEEPVSAPAVSAPVSVPEAAPETDDTELIAVIAAAIAAAREADGMDEASAGGFFVRSKSGGSAKGSPGSAKGCGSCRSRFY